MSLGCCGQLGTCLLLIPFLTFWVSLIGLPAEPVQFVRFVEIRSIQCILLENCAPGAYSSARMYVYIYILYKNHISTFIFPYQYLLIAFLVRPCQAKAGSSLGNAAFFLGISWKSQVSLQFLHVFSCLFIQFSYTSCHIF